MSEASGWARLPRWQHIALMVASTVVLVAAVANFLVTDSNGARVFHAFVAIAAGVVLVTLINAYLARTR